MPTRDAERVKRFPLKRPTADDRRPPAREHSADLARILADRQELFARSPHLDAKRHRLIHGPARDGIHIFADYAFIGRAFMVVDLAEHFLGALPPICKHW